VRVLTQLPHREQVEQFDHRASINLHAAVQSDSESAARRFWTKVDYVKGADSRFEEAGAGDDAMSASRSQRRSDVRADSSGEILEASEYVVGRSLRLCGSMNQKLAIMAQLLQ
jgi:hypothetical protein